MSRSPSARSRSSTRSRANCAAAVRADDCRVRADARARSHPPGARCLATDTCDPAFAAAWHPPVLTRRTASRSSSTRRARPAHRRAWCCAIARSSRTNGRSRPGWARSGPSSAGCRSFTTWGFGNVLQTLCAGTSLRVDVAGLVLEATGALARGDLALPRDDERRPELRVRPVRAPGQHRGARGGSTSAAGRSRSAARSPYARRRIDRFARRVRARTASRLRAFYPCYGLAEATLFVAGHRAARRRRAARSGARRSIAARSSSVADDADRSPRPGQLRHARAERGDPDRRSGHARPRDRHRRDLGPRPGRRERLLGPRRR